MCIRYAYTSYNALLQDLYSDATLSMNDENLDIMVFYVQDCELNS